MTTPPLTSRRKLLEWTKNILYKYSIKPRKHLSQNFVVEPSIIRYIINHINPDHHVLEIGAGLGTLSYYLSIHVKKYSIHFEIDHRLARIAYEALTPRSILIVSDALLHEWKVEEVTGNIPYHITSGILVKTARSNNVVKAVYVMQRDVVARITAKPGMRDYGRLSILLQLLFNIVEGPIFDPGSFYPSPEVYSQLVILERVKKYDEIHKYVEEVTRRIFSKRRKKLVKVLHEEFGVSKSEVLNILGIDENIRVYMVKPGDILRLTIYLKNTGLI